MKCECLQAGMCTRRKCEIPDVHFNRCQAGQVATIDTLYDYNPSVPHRAGLAVNPRFRNVLGVGSTLKDKIAGLLQVKTGGTCGCNTLAAQMDQWGPDECDARREYIISRLMENKEMLKDSLVSLGSTVQSIAGWTVGLGLLDPALRLGAGWLLSEAIKDVRHRLEEAANVRKLEVKTTFNSPRRRRRRGEGTPVRGPNVETIDTSNLIRNFQMHIWPSRNGAWQWNCDQVMERASLFNGRRIVSIATDKDSCSAGEVREYLKDFTTDFLEFSNDPSIREVVSFVPMLERQQSLDSNQVTFSCHSKIARHHVDEHTEDSTLYRWTSVMYETCLDHWDLVKEQLATKAMTGAFKRYGMFDTFNNHQWHYSGTFYWFRNRDVFNRDWRTVDQFFFGTESYPGLMFHPDDTGCLFADYSDDLYSLEYWNEEIQPQLERFRNERPIQTT